MIELIIETESDISSGLLSASSADAPADHYSSFLRLSENAFVRDRGAKMMENVAGLRNRLVHDYGEIDPAVVYRSIPRTLLLFRQFAVTVRKRALSA